MAFSAPIQAKSAQSAGTGSIAVAFTSNVVANNLLVACCSNNNGGGIGTSAVTDSQGNTWTRVSSAANVLGVSTAIFWAVAGSSAADTVTLTVGAGEFPTLAIFEVGITTAPASFDVQSSGTAGGGSAFATGTTGTLAKADEIAFACSSHNGGTATPTVDSGFTLASAGAGLETNSANEPIASAYKVLSATTGTGCTFTWTTGAWAACVATFKDASGGGGGSTPKLMLLGVG
jgi:hypothetical protein